MMMELVTASDLFVTASLALLLSFLVAKLVTFAMTETNHHVTGEPVAPVLQAVQTTQTESRVDFITPVQVATTTKVEETGSDTGDATTVESDSNNVVFESPEKSDIAAVDVTEEKTAAVRDDGDSAEQSRNKECVEEEREGEITEEPSTQTVVSAMESEAKERDEDEEENDDDDDDWEWEGIERSELEKVFVSATEFVAVKGCGGDGGVVQMELYGLHRVAMEGPCREPQPMPLKLSARAKWNAWQKLGNMSPEVAMERYVSLLSDKVPGWMEDTSAGMAEHKPTAGSLVSESAASNLSSSFSHQQRIVTEREHEQESGAQDTSPPLTESDLENNVKK